MENTKSKHIEIVHTQEQVSPEAQRAFLALLIAIVQRAESEQQEEQKTA